MPDWCEDTISAREVTEAARQATRRATTAARRLLHRAVAGAGATFPTATSSAAAAIGASYTPSSSLPRGLKAAQGAGFPSHVCDPSPPVNQDEDEASELAPASRPGGAREEITAIHARNEEKVVQKNTNKQGNYSSQLHSGENLSHQEEPEEPMGRNSKVNESTRLSASASHRGVERPDSEKREERTSVHAMLWRNSYKKVNLELISTGSRCD